MSEDTKPKRRYHHYTKQEKRKVISLLKRPELLISDIIEQTGLTKDTIRKINVEAGYIRKPEASRSVASTTREKQSDSRNGPVIVFDENSNSYWKFDGLTEAAIYFKKAQPSTKSEESNIENVRNSIRKACRGTNGHKLYRLLFYFLELFTKRLLVSSDRIGLSRGKWPWSGSNTIPKGLFFPRFCPL